MANETPNEPRALSAALAAPEFVSRGAGLAMHVANRHVERWAPETSANRSRPLRSLGFVDRLIAPWIETAQRSASLRMFSQMRSTGGNERAGNAVSWVFPRPWYQDELDWMAAARQTAAQAESSPTMLTTRGTYVPTQAQQQRVAPQMPAALYEYVAPSLSIAQPQPAAVTGIGYGGDAGPTRAIEAYSPLVSLASIQAAQLVARVAPLVATRTTPTLRAMLGQLVERAAMPPIAQPTRASLNAPELVTPPAPRPEQFGSSESTPAAELRLADEVAEQRQKIVDLQRVSRQVAQREQAATAPAPSAQAAVAAEAVAREAEIRAKVSDARQATAAQRVELVAAERARVEAQIAQRVAERTGVRRMHEQARVDAAIHARVEPTTTTTPTVAFTASEPVAPPRQVPPEVLAAIAALPPELARAISQRPDRAMQVIAELGDSLRTTELIARNAGRPVEVTRGPRLVMPVGLGGLVATVDRATAFAAPSPVAPMAMPTLAPAARPMTTHRMPTLPWVAQREPAGDRNVARTNAFGATVNAAPPTLQHVAWADRWLARFAGATPQSLAMLTATGSTNRDVRMQALASAAPDAVFVAPMFDNDRTEHVDRGGRIEVPAFASRTAPAAPQMQPQTGGPILVDRSPTAPQVERYDDDAATPDDVFVAISQSAARRRAPAPAVAPAVAARIELTHPTYIDGLAHAAPSAPGAGLSASLSASPFASALQHVLPLAAARSFDVRALFGGELAASYLAGLLAPATHEVAATSAMPAWARNFDLGSFGGELGGEQPARVAPEWDATYVSPSPSDDRTPEAEAEAAPAPMFAELAPLTTLRSALLSWQLDDRGGFASPTTTALETIANAGTPRATHAPVFSPAYASLDTMSLPMLGDVASEPTSTYAAPGMVGSRAHAWSVAQERSTADLAFDFVTPELVLAARVYGFGPAEAIQAARLAVAGPTQLTAMAGAVDRTFVQAMAVEVERQRAATITTAYPTGGEVRMIARPATIMQPADPTATPTTMTATTMSSSNVASPVMSPPLAPAPSSSAFGIARRAPRGAFLWPQAAVAALGLDAAVPDGAMAMTVAALELLAAQAVAEIGTYAALQPEARAAAVAAGDDVVGEPRTMLGGSVGTAAAAGATTSNATTTPTTPMTAAREPSERDVLDTVSALVPTTRRARFDALYLALGQSVTGREWSPAARAARALALVGRGDEGSTLSAHERAATVWDVLPVVYAFGDTPIGASASAKPSIASAIGSAAARRQRRVGGDLVAPDFAVDARPGLGGLSARAGEALGSYVTPTQAGSMMSSSSGGTDSSSSSSSYNDGYSAGAMARVPTAAPEFVRTGARPTGRHGGGETEIPAWFEQAARRMFDERNTGGVSDGISMSDLTLIQSTPQTQIAASERTTSAPAPHASAESPSSGTGGGDIDIEKLATDVYRQILDIMDHARARNGEPYV